MYYSIYLFVGINYCHCCSKWLLYNYNIYCQHQSSWAHLLTVTVHKLGEIQVRVYFCSSLHLRPLPTTFLLLCLFNMLVVNALQSMERKILWVSLSQLCVLLWKVCISCEKILTNHITSIISYPIECYLTRSNSHLTDSVDN